MENRVVDQEKQEQPNEQMGALEKELDFHRGMVFLKQPKSWITKFYEFWVDLYALS